MGRKRRQDKPTIKTAIFGGGLDYWGAFNPSVVDTDRMIGGAELAMIHVSRELAQRGHNLTVFYSQVDGPGEYDGVVWKNASDYSPREAYDVLIYWDSSVRAGGGILNLDPAAHLLVVEMQCAHAGIRPGHRFDWVTPKSEWHQRFLGLVNPLITPEKCYVMPNGVDVSRYTKRLPRVPGRVIWCSSPDRGLHHLLRFWPEIKARVPEAELHIFYEFEKCFEASKWNMDRRAAELWYIKTHLDQPGVVMRGPVGRQTIAKEQLQAMALVYPCDAATPVETFSIAVLECMAAGTPVVISDADCMPELWGPYASVWPRPINDGEWVEAVVSVLTDEKLWKHLSRQGQKRAQDFTWERLGNRWDRFLREKLEEARER